MKRTPLFTVLWCALAPLGCQAPADSGTAIPTGAEADAIVAEIEAIVGDIVAGANQVDADRVLSAAVRDESLSLIVGDVLLEGYDTIREDFEESYAVLQSQEHSLIEQRIRLLGPDLALALLTAVGTYTDMAGWTSEPVGLGVTLVLSREGGQWQLIHAHQSTID